MVNAMPKEYKDDASIQEPLIFILPSEILSVIFQWLALRDLPAVTKTCSRFKDDASIALKNARKVLTTNLAKKTAQYLIAFITESETAHKGFDFKQNNYRCLELVYDRVKTLFFMDGHDYIRPTPEVVAVNLIDELHAKAKVDANVTFNQLINPNNHPVGLTYIHLFASLGFPGIKALVLLVAAGAHINAFNSDEGNWYDTPWQGFFDHIHNSHADGKTLNQKPIKDYVLNANFLKCIISLGANFNFSIENHQSANQSILSGNIDTPEFYQAITTLFMIGQLKLASETGCEKQLHEKISVYQMTMFNSRNRVDQAVIDILRAIRGAIAYDQNVQDVDGKIKRVDDFTSQFHNFAFCTALLLEQSPKIVANSLIETVRAEADNDEKLFIKLINLPGCSGQRIVDIFNTIGDRSALECLQKSGVEEVSMRNIDSQESLQLKKQRVNY